MIKTRGFNAYAHIVLYRKSGKSVNKKPITCRLDTHTHRGYESQNAKLGRWCMGVAHRHIGNPILTSWVSIGGLAIP